MNLYSKKVIDMDDKKEIGLTYDFSIWKDTTDCFTMEILRSYFLYGMTSRRTEVRKV